MKKIFLIFSIIFIYQIAAIYPPPKSVKLTGQYIHIANVCNLYQTFTDDVN